MAVSSESMMASVPSRMALATSVASARVGRRSLTMLLSIWVAMMTGLPSWLHLRTSVFCTMGTCSTGISTPRSPRATITASAAARMASMCSTAWRVSILATILVSLPSSSPRTKATSLALRTNEAAT